MEVNDKLWIIEKPNGGLQMDVNDVFWKIEKSTEGLRNVELNDLLCSIGETGLPLEMHDLPGRNEKKVQKRN